MIGEIGKLLTVIRVASTLDGKISNSLVSGPLVYVDIY